MARTNDINSATSQFFVNSSTTTSSTTSRGGFGYAVFGNVAGHGRRRRDRRGARPAARACYQDVPLEDRRHRVGTRVDRRSVRLIA